MTVLWPEIRLGCKLLSSAGSCNCRHPPQEWTELGGNFWKGSWTVIHESRRNFLQVFQVKSRGGKGNFSSPNKQKVNFRTLVFNVFDFYQLQILCTSGSQAGYLDTQNGAKPMCSHLQITCCESGSLWTHTASTFLNNFIMDLPFQKIEANNYGNFKPLSAQTKHMNIKGAERAVTSPLEDSRTPYICFQRAAGPWTSSMFPVNFLQVTVEELGEGQGKSTIPSVRMSIWGDISDKQNTPSKNPWDYDTWDVLFLVWLEPISNLPIYTVMYCWVSSYQMKIRNLSKGFVFSWGLY